MTTAFILVVLFLLIWMIRFIAGNFGKALKQREFPPETRAPIRWLG